MTDTEFEGYWAALGKAVRIAARAEHRASHALAHDPVSLATADTERAPSWDHDKRSPLTATIGFTRK